MGCCVGITVGVCDGGVLGCFVGYSVCEKSSKVIICQMQQNNTTKKSLKSRCRPKYINTIIFWGNLYDASQKKKSRIILHVSSTKKKVSGNIIYIQKQVHGIFVMYNS